MTREDFLARCAVLYDGGYITETRRALLRDWVDGVMRLEHSLLTNGQPQWRMVYDLAVMEERRLRDTQGGYRTLANDPEGLGLVQLTANLAHPCQTCATDPQAWWTRPGGCRHRRRTS